MFRKLKLWFQLKVLKRNLLLNATVQTFHKQVAKKVFAAAGVPEHAIVFWSYSFNGAGERVKKFRATWYAHGTPIETKHLAASGSKFCTYKDFIK